MLFICTGNYYRSRYAEALFNHHAEERASSWRAFSRGLAIEMAMGDLSSYIVARLEMNGIDRRHTSPTRTRLEEEDLRRATRVVALDATEHRPMFEAQFPEWSERVDFWSIQDVHFVPAEFALPSLEARVETLLTELGIVPTRG